MQKRTSIHVKKVILLTVILLTGVITTGCWNYKEINDIWMVGGTAIDWDAQNRQYIITAEIVKPMGGQDTKIVSESISIKSDTIFNAIREGITISGKRLYWAHTNIVIVSDAIARKGIAPVLDIIARGGEFRASLWLAVSRENTAKEILQNKLNIFDASSFQVAETLKSQKSTSTFLDSEVWFFQKDLSDEGISPVLSSIKLLQENNKLSIQAYGSAVFKSDKLEGYLDDMETKSLLFVRNELKGGVIALKDVAGTDTNVSCEILNSKTALNPQIMNGNINMNIDIKTDVAIPEIGGMVNFLDDAGRMKLKDAVKKEITGQMLKLIGKAQNDLGIDILGFGKAIQKKYPKQWKELKPDWDEKFKTVKSNVSVDVNIINSYRLYKPVPVGD